MMTLHLRFAWDLREVSPDRNENPHGPLFHRWLPNGQQHALTIDTKDPNATLRVWFDRRGFVNETGQIQYHRDRKEVDAAVIPRQHKLDAGPLLGSLVLTNVSESQLNAIRENLLGDENYLRLGKRIVRLISPPVGRLIRILKIKYGQYWLRDLEPFDSRNGSLGHYCGFLYLNWSLDGGTNWNRFMPDDAVIRVRGRLDDDFHEYLTEDDWESIRSFYAEEYEPTVAGQLLANCHRLHTEGNLRYAIVEGISALEISINEFFDNHYQGKLRDIVLGDAKVEDLRLVVKTALLGRLVSGVRQEDIEHAIAVIDARNALIHEGKTPSGDIESNLKGLIRVVAGLLGKGAWKFPGLHRGNRIDNT